MIYGYDPTYVLVLFGALLCILASTAVNSTVRKYDKMWCSRGITGAEAAEEILRAAGINDVQIARVGGDLTDNYSMLNKRLSLSDSVSNVASVSAIGIAAHECGHAIQDHEGFFPMKIKSTIAPVANIGSRLSLPLIVLGLIIGFIKLTYVGIALFGFVVIFQLLTLPVEFDASRRAVKIIEERNLLSKEELSGAKKVLFAAAMTYVAALCSSVLQLLRFVLIAGNRRDKD